MLITLMSALEKQISLSDYNDSDILESTGYRPELNRNFSMLQVFGVAFSMLPSIATTLAFSLLAGLYGMVWG